VIHLPAYTTDNTYLLPQGVKWIAFGKDTQVGVYVTILVTFKTSDLIIRPQTYECGIAASSTPSY
jgi:hypothetical protein